MRLRILFGTMLLLVGLALYAVAVTAAAQRLPGHWAAAAVFYAVAGLAWIYPAAALVRWMQRAAPFRPPSLD
jgi:hypothetical protein